MDKEVVTADDDAVNGSNRRSVDDDAVDGSNRRSVDDAVNGSDGYSTRSRRGSGLRKNYAEIEAGVLFNNNNNNNNRKKRTRKVALVTEDAANNNNNNNNNNEGGGGEQKINKADPKWIAEQSVMCHQCQRNDKGRVVRCQNCKRKRYCIPCATAWYPHMTEDQISQCCPFMLYMCCLKVY
ncbi:hypothetical protein ACFE04_020112 [Oxalis oulophora]